MGQAVCDSRAVFWLVFTVIGLVFLLSTTAAVSQSGFKSHKLLQCFCLCSSSCKNISGTTELHLQLWTGWPEIQKLGKKTQPTYGAEVCQQYTACAELAPCGSWGLSYHRLSHTLFNLHILLTEIFSSTILSLVSNSMPLLKTVHVLASSGL